MRSHRGKYGISMQVVYLSQKSIRARKLRYENSKVVKEARKLEGVAERIQWGVGQQSLRKRPPVRP
jgi:hypothetical protein